VTNELKNLPIIRYFSVFLIILTFLIHVLISCNQDSRNEQPADGMKVTDESPRKLPPGAIEFDYSNLVLMVELTVNDSLTGNFVFDTGSSYLFLDSQFVEQNRFPLSTDKTRRVTGVGESFQIAPTVDSIKLAFENLFYEYASIPVINIRSLAGFEVDGVFGIELFSPHVLKINFDSTYLQLLDTGEFKSPQGYDSLKLYYQDNKTIIHCSAELTASDHIEGYTILDLGSGQSLTLTSIVGEENRLAQVIEYKYAVTRENGGYGGRTRSWYFRGEKITISSFNLENPVMNYSTDRSGALSWSSVLGLLGMEIMDRFNMIFDFHDHILYLKPNSRFGKHFDSNMTGFIGKIVQGSRGKKYRILNIIEGSPAEKAGLQKGDEILFINGNDPSTMTNEERRVLLNQDHVLLWILVRRNNSQEMILLFTEELL
jgi:hypothetical protein